MAWEFFDHGATDVIGRANVDFIHATQNIQHHHRESIDPTQPRGVADCHSIKPAASSRSACGGSILLADIPDALAHLVMKFGGEWAAADSRGIAFRDSNNLIDPPWRDSRACTDPQARTVAAGDKREGSMINVQKSALGTFKEQLLARFRCVKEQRVGVANQVLQLLRVALVLTDNFICIQTRYL